MSEKAYNLKVVTFNGQQIGIYFTVFHVVRLDSERDWPANKQDINEFHYVKEGIVKVIINKKAFYAKKGDVFYVRNGDFHTEHAFTGSTMLCFSFYKRQIKHPLIKEKPMSPEKVMMLENLSSFPSYLFKASEALEKNVELMFEAIRKKDEVTPEFTASARFVILELAENLQKAVSSNYKRIINLNIPEKRVKDAVRDAVIYLKQYSTQTVDMKKLSKDLNLSYSYFVRIFKKHIGVAPKTYQIEERLRDAAGLLKKTDIKVDEVLTRAGFRNRAQFFNLFTKQYGLSPDSYRKNKK